MNSSYLPSARPSARQLEFQDWEFGLFFHFGLRTFYEGYCDFDPRPMDPKTFNPSSLGCDQWVRTARMAGARYAVLTAKHHDGFALWPSKYTDFSVASSCWKDGKGDVIREFTEACRLYGIKPGLYYSPYDHNTPAYADPKAYDDYFINQIGELLTGYGQIDLLWFDGCGSENHTYDWPRIIKEIRRMQPEILIFNMGDPNYRWVGNEDGIAPCPCWNTVREVDFSVQTNEKEKLDAVKWLPAECDARMRERNWYYSEADEQTVKSLEELMGMYYYSVGRGCNLILNIGPDRRGLLPEKDVLRLLEFGGEIKRRFASPVATIQQFTREKNIYEYSPTTSIYFDHAIIQEDLTQGEQVRNFTLNVQTLYGHDRLKIYQGENIGHKAICRFPLIRAKKVWLETNQDVTLKELSLFRSF